MLCALTSEATKEFPDNTSQGFTVKLPYTFHLNENWEVSLAGISIPKISDDHTVTIRSVTDETIEEDDETIERLEEHPTHTLKNKNVINIPLKPEDSGKDIIEKYVSDILRRHRIKAFVNEEGHCQIEGEVNTIINFSPFIQRLLGWNDSKTMRTGDGVIVSPNAVTTNQALFFHVGSDIVVNGVINWMYKPLLQVNLPLNTDTPIFNNQN